MIIIHLMIGALSATGLLFLFDYVRKLNLNLKWWHWLLTVSGMLYTVLVIEMIIGFFAEGAPQAALVMGLAAGIIVVVWGVLLRRFVFIKK